MRDCIGYNRGRHHSRQVIDDSLVVERDVCDFGERCKDNVEVSDLRLGLALGQPGTGGSTLTVEAVPVAAIVVGDLLMAAVLASLEMTAQGRGTTKWAGSAASAFRGILCEFEPHRSIRKYRGIDLPAGSNA